MENLTLRTILEALLFVSEKPLTVKEMQEALRGQSTNAAPEEIKAQLLELNAEYQSTGRSFAVQETAAGFQLKTLPQYAPYIAALYKDQMRERLSLAALETLAIVAYKQPVTRADVEAIRGVSIDGIMKTLLDKNLVEVVGKKDVPGYPSLLGTSKRFLMHFGLKDLQDLPNMEEFKEALVAREAQMAQHRQAAGVEEQMAEAKEPS